MTGAEPPPPSGQGPAGGPADQEELQRRLEEQLRKVRVQDLLLESVVSVLNLSARRIAKEDERDLDQARVGIEAVRAVVEMLEPGPRQQVREALSQVQVLYAREAGGGKQPSAAEQGGGEPGKGPASEPRQEPKTERPSGLWTPPGAS